MENYAMPFIYSTLTCSNSFAIYAPKTDPKSLSRIVKRIEVHGGHGMKHPKSLDTPMGVVTKVTDEELELLNKDLTFQQHVKDGYLVIDNKKVEPSKIAASMNPKDESAPLTPKDFEKSEDGTEEVPIYKKKGK